MATPKSNSEGPDPILLTLFANRFMSVAEAMGRSLQQTAISTNIKERLDFSCALFAPDGDLVASMISTAVIPLICKVIEGGALDVYSQNHIMRMVDLSEEIEASLDPGNIKFQVRFDFSFNLISI